MKKVTIDIESAEMEVAQLEERQETLELLLQNPSQEGVDDSVFKEYEVVQNRLQAKMELWETLHQRLEELEAQRLELDGQ